MSDRFAYRCPECGTTNRVHGIGCKYEHVEIHEFERCYVAIISALLDYMSLMEEYDKNPAMPREELVEKIEEMPDYTKPPKDEDNLDLESVEVEPEPQTQDFDEVMADCLNRLKQERRVMETPDGLLLTTPEERVEQVIPTFEPIQTIYECGPVDGAKDYSVYTMVSWCSLKEMSWEQTCNFVREWLEETGAWERESWGESSIDELLSNKRHVWANDLGWGDMANAAKQEIDSSGIDPQIDVDNKIGAEPTDYGDDA